MGKREFDYWMLRGQAMMDDVTDERSVSRGLKAAVTALDRTEGLDELLSGVAEDPTLTDKERIMIGYTLGAVGVVGRLAEQPGVIIDNTLVSTIGNVRGAQDV